jgi:hypothetical protein
MMTNLLQCHDGLMHQPSVPFSSSSDPLAELDGLLAPGDTFSSHENPLAGTGDRSYVSYE